MSSKSTEDQNNSLIDSENSEDVPLGRVISEIIIPLSSFYPPRSEKMTSKRSPIHLALLKLEFEDACRKFFAKRREK